MLKSVVCRAHIRAISVVIVMMAMLVPILISSAGSQPAEAQVDDGLFGIPPANATYLGVKPVDSFSVGVLEYDAWSYRDIVFYSPPGKVSQEMANQWLAWYQATDDILRILVGEEHGFEDRYRRYDANVGRRVKVILTPPDSCGAGCGSKAQAEGVGIIDDMVREPDNFEHHWILFYEQARGGRDETFDLSAGWPRENYVLPHLVAALTYYEIAGPSGVQRGLPKDVYDSIDQWSNYNKSYVDQFVEREQRFFFDQYSNGLYIYPPFASIHLRIALENDIATTARVLDELRHYPDNFVYEDSTQAMCDFRAAVSTGTNGRYDQISVNQWRMPANCDNVFDTSGSNDRVSPDDLFFGQSKLCVDHRFNPSSALVGLNAAVVGLLPCDGTQAQRAELMELPNGLYSIKMGDGGECLENSNREITFMILWECHGGQNQAWQLDGTTLKSADGNYCLTGTPKNRWGGGLMSLESCDGRAEQQLSWSGLPDSDGLSSQDGDQPSPSEPEPEPEPQPQPQPQPTGSYSLQNVLSGKCIDLAGDIGVDMIQWSCHGGGNQRLVATEVAGGVRLAFDGSGPCLDVSGSRLLAWSCHGGGNQVFYWSGSQVVSAASGECITVQNPARENRATVAMAPCTNQAEQQFQAG